ncbi:MAG: hypothetical protein ACRD0K_12805 [Egibacteraceae bacterium]
MGQREEEAEAKIIAALAADIDAVVWRGDQAVRKLVKLDAEPNKVVAARRALDSMHEVARALRRDGLLPLPQQRLL